MVGGEVPEGWRSKDKYAVFCGVEEMKTNKKIRYWAQLAHWQLAPKRIGGTPPLVIYLE